MPQQNWISITQKGLNYVNASQGAPKFSLKYFVPIYDPSIDENFTGSPINTEDRHDSASEFYDDSYTKQDEIIWNPSSATAAYLLKNQDMRKVLADASTLNGFTVEGTKTGPDGSASDNVISNYYTPDSASITASTIREYYQTTGLVTTSDGALTGTWDFTSDAAWELTAETNPITITSDDDITPSMLWSGISYFPSYSGENPADPTEIKGLFTCQIRNSTTGSNNSFKFNKLAIFLQPTATDGTDIPGSTPILFCYVLLNRVQVKDISGIIGTADFNIQFELDFFINQGGGTNEFTTSSDYWTQILSYSNLENNSSNKALAYDAPVWLVDTTVTPQQAWPLHSRAMFNAFTTNFAPATMNELSRVDSYSIASATDGVEVPGVVTLGMRKYADDMRTFVVNPNASLIGGEERTVGGSTFGLSLSAENQKGALGDNTILLGNLNEIDKDSSNAIILTDLNTNSHKFNGSANNGYQMDSIGSFREIAWTQTLAPKYHQSFNSIFSVSVVNARLNLNDSILSGSLRYASDTDGLNDLGLIYAITRSSLSGLISNTTTLDDTNSGTFINDTIINGLATLNIKNFKKNLVLSDQVTFSLDNGIIFENSSNENGIYVGGLLQIPSNSNVYDNRIIVGQDLLIDQSSATWNSNNGTSSSLVITGKNQTLDSTVIGSHRGSVFITDDYGLNGDLKNKISSEHAMIGMSNVRTREVTDPTYTVDYFDEIKFNNALILTDILYSRNLDVTAGGEDFLEIQGLIVGKSNCIINERNGYDPLPVNIVGDDNILSSVKSGTIFGFGNSVNIQNAIGLSPKTNEPDIDNTVRLSSLSSSMSINILGDDNKFLAGIATQGYEGNNAAFYKKRFATELSPTNTESPLPGGTYDWDFSKYTIIGSSTAQHYTFDSRFESRVDESGGPTLNPLTYTSNEFATFLTVTSNGLLNTVANSSTGPAVNMLEITATKLSTDFFTNGSGELSDLNVQGNARGGWIAGFRLPIEYMHYTNTSDTNTNIKKLIQFNPIGGLYLEYNSVDDDGSAYVKVRVK